MLGSAGASGMPKARTTFQHTAGERDGTHATLRRPLTGLGTKSGQLPAQPFADPTAGTVIGHMQSQLPKLPLAKATVVPFSWQISLPQHGEEPRPAPVQAAELLKQS